MPGSPKKRARTQEMREREKILRQRRAEAKRVMAEANGPAPDVTEDESPMDSSVSFDFENVKPSLPPKEVVPAVVREEAKAAGVSPKFMAEMLAELRKLGFGLDAQGNVKVQDPAVAASTRPGTIIGAGTGMPRKIPYTKAWFEANYPTVTFTPRDNKPVIVNGVRWDLFAEVEFTGPSIVHDVYEWSRRETMTYYRAKQAGDERAMSIVRRLEPEGYEPPDEVSRSVVAAVQQQLAQNR